MKLKSMLAYAAAGIMLLGCSFNANAQKGEKTLGVKGGYASYNDGGYADVYFQFGLANHVRLAPAIGYVFRNDHKSAFTLDLDVQFPFRIVKALNVYPLVGFTFNNWNYTHHDDASRAGANFGAGFDIYLTQNLKMNIEGKYSMMNDTGGAFFGVGLGYVF